MEVSDKLHTPAPYPWKEPITSIEWEAGWAPKTVWAYEL